MKLIVDSNEPERDLEAIAKSRVNRLERKNMNRWLVASLLVVAVGVLGGFVNKQLGSFGGIVIVGGFLVFFYYMQFVLAKKQKQATLELITEWRKGDK